MKEQNLVELNNKLEQLYDDSVKLWDAVCELQIENNLLRKKVEQNEVNKVG